MKEETPQYDRNASQRVPMKTVVGDEAFEFAFVVNMPSDSEIIAAIAADAGEGEATIYKPLFKANIIGAENCADDNGQEFSAFELANVVPDEDQAFVFSSALLTAAVEAKPVAKGKKLNWTKKVETIRHQLKCYFNGAFITTGHRLAAVNTKEIAKAYDQMVERKFPVQFGDHTFNNIPEGLCVLYDALVRDAYNYVGGVVPAHHKMAIARAHFEGERELLLGK